MSANWLTAGEYASRGWPVLPVNHEKVPVIAGGCKSATTDHAQIAKWFRARPNENVAIATGSVSGIYVVDIDPEGLQHEEALRLPATYTVTTPRGGKHLYYKRPEGEKWGNTASKLAPGIDTRGDGGFVVAPPSKTKVGRYTLARDVEPVALPAHIMDMLAPKALAVVATGKQDLQHAPRITETRLDSYAQKALDAECNNVRSAPAGTRNAALNKAACALGGLVASGMILESTAVAELHSAAMANGLEHAETVKTINSGLAAGMRTPRQVQWKAEPARVQRQVVDSVSADFELQQPVKDITELSKDEKTGKVKTTVGNLRKIIAMEFGDMLCFNELMSRAWWKEAPPWRDAPGQVVDADASDCCAWLEDEYKLAFGMESVIQIMEHVASKNLWNEVHEFVSGLTWDGVPRLTGWLTRFAGVECNDLNDAIGRKWLISAVARVLSPGCKADHVLVLEGKTGKGKSSLLGILGGKWHTENLPDMHSANAQQILAKYWIIELGELGALRRSEIEEVKRFITTCVDTYRRSYAKTFSDVPRRCIFAGTTEESNYLADQKGNRRFWPVKVTNVDFDGLAAAREQLFAEAVHAFKSGEKWHFEAEGNDKRLIGDLVELQRSRMTTDVWEDILAEKLSNRTTSFTTKDALGWCNLSVDKMNGAEQKRCTTYLRKLGWEIVKKKFGNVWERAEADEVDPKGAKGGPSENRVHQQTTSTVDLVDPVDPFSHNKEKLEIIKDYSLEFRPSTGSTIHPGSTNQGLFDEWKAGDA